MTKLDYYLKNEHHFDVNELQEMFGENYTHFLYEMQRKELLDPTTLDGERLMRESADNFMLDNNNTRKKKIIKSIL